MPLGYEAPAFWPFTENDLVKVGSSVSRDYVPDILQKLRLLEGAVVEEEHSLDVDNLTSEELYETMTVSNRLIYDNIVNQLKLARDYLALYPDDAYTKKLIKKYESQLADIENKQREILRG